MISDALTRLAGSSGSSAAPQDISALTAATPILSEHWFDIADQKDPKRGGNIAGLGDIFATMTVAASLASAAADATFRLQLVTLPRASLAGQTVTVDNTTDIWTISSGDFLPNGTLVTLSSAGTLPAGTAASTHYYVYRDDDITDPANTFKLATTPSGSDRANANTSTVVNATSNGTGAHTITAVPQIVADSGEVPLGRLQSVDTNTAAVGQPVYSNAAADRLVITTNPLPHSPVAPLQRYVFARLSVSDDLTAGEVFIDCGCGVPDNRGIFHASGFQVQ